MGTPPRKGRPRTRRRGKTRGKRQPPSRLRRALLRAVRLFLLLVVPAALLSVVWIDRTVNRRFHERITTFPSRVYAAPWTLRQGDRLDPDALVAELDHLGYRQVDREPVRPGEYRRDGKQDWSVFVREATTGRGVRPAALVQVEAWWGKVRRIRDGSTTEALGSFSLEPRPLVTFYDDLQEERQWTRLESIPPLLARAVVSVEDRRFREHHGVDLTGIARALWADIKAGSMVQGGSTITQQLVKNLLGPRRSVLARKGIEAVGALTLELHQDKDAILEAYLNEVYLGQRGAVAISGVGEASRFYFGRTVEELDLPRSALLAGIIKNPGRFNPFRHPERARGRRDVVLDLMLENGVIDEAAMRSAKAAALGVRGPEAGGDRFPWVEGYLAEEIRRITPEALPGAGFSIFTTIDPRVQRAAGAALENGLARVEARLGRKDGPPLEGALVVLSPEDGAILALVGGRDHGRSQFNRALLSRRPPGSTFKPFVFLAAFERSLLDDGFSFTAATVLEDEPLAIHSGGSNWAPANYDRTFRGPVTARRALEESINVPTVRAGMLVGPERVVEMARRCGIGSDLEALPSLALGTEEVTPLELAGAYATFANGGWRIRPHALAGAVDRAGKPFAELEVEAVRALSPDLAYLVTHLLEGVMTRGTGRTSARLGFTGHAAGKTGSSDDLRDAWFVGYTARLLALVWVGYDDNRPVGLPGASAALPVWVDLMNRLGVDGDDEFHRPRGIIETTIDPATGGRAVRRCPGVVREVFVRGTEPRDLCPEHGGKRRGFWRRLFGRD